MNPDSNDDDSWSIFSLSENLSSSYVDPNKLISIETQNQKPIGMANFKSRFQNRSFSGQKSFHNGYGANNLSTANIARLRWKSAASKVKMLNDPWSEFKIDYYPAENAIRHRYNAIKKNWVKDECTVKIEHEQFANGAMRACFRLKKLSNFVHKNSWEHASNYVAKSYMDPEIPRERYFDDVKLQMDAKLWAEIYNRHNPPKKIDMFQVSIVEFKDRPNSPLFHLEHFIDGKYIKYNSNSGFVDDVHIRYTPQAFSHFTFECSNHELIVVDIQGVGDLYTDPQIHTAKGTEYGDGNLGIKGMALFFSSHLCNDVCRSLGLTQFDLAISESKSHEKILNNMQKFCLTQRRGSEESVIGSPSSFGEYFRQRIRSRSDTSMGSDDNNNSTELPDIDESEGYESSSVSPLWSTSSVFLSNSKSSQAISFHKRENLLNSSSPISIPVSASPLQISNNNKYTRTRNESSCLDSAFSNDEALHYFNTKKNNKPRPSCVMAEKNYISKIYCNEEDDTENDESNNFIKNQINFFDQEESILGKIHLELCKYHEIGRFALEGEEFNVEAAFLHLKQSAYLGVKEGLLNLAKIHLQQPHDILPNYKVENTDFNLDIGFDLMVQCSEKNEKSAMLFIAKALDNGIGLSKNKSIDWLKSIEYYQKVLNVSYDEPNEETSLSELSTECEPTYLILARMAEMNFIGGKNLEKDLSEAASLYTEAAEKAMSYGKGRLANKYYTLSEQASSLAEDF